jgi:undecaprenyl-phosphate galactose phosphotransferase
MGNFDDIPTIVQEHGIDEILVAISDVTHEELLAVLDICKSAQVNLKVTSTIFSIIHEKVSTESYYSIPTARILNLSERKGLLVMKHIIDIAGALLGIALLLVPSIILALLIKTTSKGPVFYRQKRIGKNGKEFDFYKFRSMYVGSDHDQGREEKLAYYIRNGEGDNAATTKVVNENMITPVGRFIRKTSLDELPQLFNVLQGDMSLVGPRPCLPYEYKAYDEWHKRRLSVLPGCTGLWQVSNRAKGGFDDMVLLDLFYIDNMSPWFDIQLILKTIPVMIFARGGK